MIKILIIINQLNKKKVKISKKFQKNKVKMTRVLILGNKTRIIIKNKHLAL